MRSIFQTLKRKLLLNRQSVRAIGWGAATIVGGSLAMATVIGIAAVAAMLLRGESAEVIVESLPTSTGLAVFVALGGLTMNVAGGYVAGRISQGREVRHALQAAVLAILLNVLLAQLWGDADSIVIEMASLALVAPFAALGGWLAMPVPQTAPIAVKQRR